MRNDTQKADVKQIIVELGYEGGGMTVYGRSAEGVWVFWSEGSSIDLDENDDEVWREWKTEESADLDTVLSDEWIMGHPIKIHPRFRDYLKAAYKKQLEVLRPELKEIHEKYMAVRWKRILQ